MPAIDSFLATWSPRVLSVLRIMVGLLFLEHGMSKYFSLPVSPSTGVAPMSLSGINGMIELVGGVLIVLGLFTRPVAFILAGDMAFAYFIAHAPRGFFPLLNVTCSAKGARLGSAIEISCCVWRVRFLPPAFSPGAGCVCALENAGANASRAQAAPARPSRDRLTVILGILIDKPIAKPGVPFSSRSSVSWWSPLPSSANWQASSGKKAAGKIRRSTSSSKCW